MPAHHPTPRCGTCRHASHRNPDVYPTETRNCPFGGGQIVMAYNSACPHYEPRTASPRNNPARYVKQQKGDTSMFNTIQVGQIHRISHTEVFNSDKEGITQTLTLTVNCPRPTVDAVLQLAKQGAPVFVELGTIQERMPLEGASDPEQGEMGQDVNPEETEPD